MRSLLVFLIFLVLNPVSALAQEVLGESWPKIIDELRQQGIKKVGDLDLNEFSEKARTTIKWQYLKRDAPSVITGARTSAVYIHDEEKGWHEVYVNPTLPKEVAQYMSDLELHEALGALGYEDQQYSLSGSLRLLLDSENPEDRKKMLKSFGKSLFKKDNLKIEGGSSVGGGGDIRALLIKKQVLADIIKTEGQVTLEFLTAYPAISFEPLASNSVDYVTLRYEFRSAGSIAARGPIPRTPIINGYQELLAVWIPMHSWEKSDSEKKRIIKEIREKVVGLFPASPRRKGVRALPICEGKQKMYFPISNDPDVVYVQYNRGGALKNCFDMMGQQNITVTTPGVPEDAVPFEPGKYYYDCRWKLGNKEFRELMSRGAGAGRVLHGFQVGLEETLTAWANVLLEEDGNASRIYLSLRRDGQEFKKENYIIKDIKKQGDSVSTTYKGQKLSFSCQRRN